MNSIKLNGNGETDQVRAARPQVSERVGAEANQPAVSVNPLEKSDALSVSDKGTTVNRFVARVLELPEVRQERVQALRSQIQAGQYRPSAAEIADALIKSEK